MALTKEYIIQKSIDILNRDGIDGLTMRLLAKELNIKAASLYWHFKDKAELYAAISETLCAAMALPSAMTNPQQYLSDVFHRFRNILLDVRDSAVVFENSIPFTPKRVNLIRAVFDALLAFGVHAENIVTVSNMLNNYVLSFVADEYRFKRITGGQVEEWIENLPPLDKQLFTMSRDFDAQFDYGLLVLFEGMKQMTG